MSPTDWTSLNPKALVHDLWMVGVNHVSGEECVRRTVVDKDISQPTRIIAVGKAAASMAKGALEQYDATTPCLIVTKYDHSDASLSQYKALTSFEAAHPIPDENSLKAGQTILDTVQAMEAESHLLLLVSGGASSLADVLHAGKTLDDLASLNKRMMSEDLTIEEINSERQTLSKIKGGGLLAQFKGARVTVIMISDVDGDKPHVIGSGIGIVANDFNPSFEMNTYIPANNEQARQVIATKGQELRIPVIENSENLSGEISSLAPILAQGLKDGECGLYIWGGEPTVNLPKNPGRGGRNQALALLLAREIAGEAGISLIVGGTDGTDGPTDAAGGLVDGSTYMAAHDKAISDANAGEALEASNALLVTGPTGTNVMDIIVALKQ